MTVIDAGEIRLGDVISFLRGRLVPEEPENLPRMLVTGILPISGESKRRAPSRAMNEYSVYHRPVDGGDLSNRRLTQVAKVIRWEAGV